MKQSAFILRGILAACALSAAGLPALAANPSQSAPTKQQRTATLKKEINAAYAEQQGACKRGASAQRSACLAQARQTYQHDMANIPTLLADAPAGGVTERVVTTTPAAPGAAAYGNSSGGSTGSGSGSGSVDAIPPSGGQAGGLPPPVDQPNPVEPSQPPQGNIPPAQQQ